ncbi:MAG: MarR family winged helix-turn-helix transcriptional regulator [Pigmentiphaga sp.]
MNAPADDTRALLQHWRNALPNDRLAHLIKDATRALVRALQVRLADHEVSFGHWTFLRILWEEDGLTQRQLSQQAGVMEPTTYTAVKALEALGYAERRHLPGNRKNMHVFLTDTGRELQHKLVPLAKEVNAISVTGLSTEEIATTRRVLLAMLDNLARDEAELEAQDRRMPSTRDLAHRTR